MFGFWKKGKQKKAEQERIKNAPRKVRLNRAQYNIVDGWGKNQISPSVVETQNEDEILNPSSRARLLNVTRNLMRNSSLFATLMLQLESNVVGTCGGKVILNFADEVKAKDIRKRFAAWTRNADFFDGNDFNHLLKIFLKQEIIGGDLVVLFDHQIEKSGRLIYFESDEVVSRMPDEVIERHYGKGAKMSLGKVYSANGRWIGTVVSKAARGLTDVPEDKCFFLTRDPNGNPLDEFWIQPSTAWRSRSRGISRAATAVSTATQLEDLILSELEASRKNAQTFCWLKSNQEEQEEVPTAFGNDHDGDKVDIANMTDEEVEKMVNAETDDVSDISLNVARENSVAFQQLPPGWTADMLDTKHPNTNVETMTNYLSGRVAAVLGLSRAFAVGNPTNEDFRAQQLLSAPAIIQYQKDLERICDWVFANFCRFIGDDKAYDELLVAGAVTWEWKRLDSCDEVSTENANALKLKNMTGTYREILGNDWRERLLQSAEEAKWMREHGLTPPSSLMLSGGETTAEKTNAGQVVQVDNVNNLEKK